MFEDRKIGVVRMFTLCHAQKPYYSMASEQQSYSIQAITDVSDNNVQQEWCGIYYGLYYGRCFKSVVFFDAVIL